MIDLEYIKNFYPAHIGGNTNFSKHLLKEHILGRDVKLIVSGICISR